MPQKILLVRTSSLGDIIHTLPVAYDIKQAMPDAKLHWLAEDSFADVCTLSPFVDEVKKRRFDAGESLYFRRRPGAKSAR